MGQHITNPVAQAAKRGDILKSDRVKPVRVGSRFGGAVSDRDYITAANGTIRRKRPKVRGKANVKRAKRLRRLARVIATPKAA